MKICKCPSFKRIGHKTSFSYEMNINRENENVNWQRLQVLSHTDSVRYSWALGHLAHTQNVNKFCDCLRPGTQGHVGNENYVFTAGEELKDKAISYHAKTSNTNLTLGLNYSGLGSRGRRTFCHDRRVRTFPWLGGSCRLSLEFKYDSGSLKASFLFIMWV